MSQKEFFNILAEFFERMTGSTAEDFANPGEFGDAVRANAHRIGAHGQSAWPWGVNALFDYYKRHQFENFKTARQQGGMKLVLGGSSRFLATQLDSVRKMSLYTDTILVPDPVLPWLEVERREEKFSRVHMLENVFTLLHLKPLVDADLSYPAVHVFQSWEKGLEAHDRETRERIKNLAVNFFSYYLGHSFESDDDVIQYARTQEEDFLRGVEAHNLFIPPEGRAGQKLEEAIQQYHREATRWRTPEYVSVLEKLSSGELVWLGILERLSPQWHMIENADELNAQPMMCLEAHWHYHTLCAKLFEGRLLEGKLLKPATVSTLRALGDTRFEWLGNVPIKALADMRERNENEEFRKKISGFVAELHASAVADLDRVAAEVGRGIASLLADHKNKVRDLEEKYQRRHAQTAIGAWITLGAVFLPVLAPFVSILPPLAILSKYAYDKGEEIADRRKSARSLTGILAAVHSSSDRD